MKKQTFNKAALLILFLPMLLQGCGDGDDERNQELINLESRLLLQYIEDNNITQEPTASGLYYLEIEEGTGLTALTDYIVDFNYTTELVDGTVIGTSYENFAEEKDIHSETIIYGPIRSRVGYTRIPGLDEGLTYMKEKGISKMILPSSINGLGGASTPASPSYSTHIYTIELINAFEDPVLFEVNQINNYMDEQEFDSVYTTETGLRYIEQESGEGEKIISGDIVELKYTGSFIDGRIFDSNVDGNVMRVFMPAVNYIPAWDEALRLMRQGTKARIIIPYTLGYGDYGYEAIPPYMTLIFDIEITKVTKS